MIVSSVDIAAGKLGVSSPETNKSHQSDDGRDAHSKSYGMDFTIRLLHNLDFFHENELYRPLPVDDVKRFERGMEQ